MRQRYLLGSVLFAATAAISLTAWGRSSQSASTKDQKAQQNAVQARDLKALQGKWSVVRAKELGDDFDKLKENTSYTFDANTLTKSVDGKDVTGTFTLDASQRPKRLVWTHPGKDNKEETTAFIYSFDEDQLVLVCNASGGTLRKDLPPTDFGTEFGLFLRLERHKDDIEARELKRLQGNWKVVRRSFVGQTQKVDRMFYTFKDNTLIFSIRGETIFSGNFRLDVSTRPRSLKWSYIEGGKVVTAGFTYSFDDDQLLLSQSVEGWSTQAKPPDDFGNKYTSFQRLEQVKD